MNGDRTADPRIPAGDQGDFTFQFFTAFIVIGNEYRLRIHFFFNTRLSILCVAVNLFIDFLVLLFIIHGIPPFSNVNYIYPNHWELLKVLIYDKIFL